MFFPDVLEDSESKVPVNSDMIFVHALPVSPAFVLQVHKNGAAKVAFARLPLALQFHLENAPMHMLRLCRVKMHFLARVEAHP